MRLYEKRHEYTRTRMVQLASFLVADSVESYQVDSIDGDSVEAIFDPPELDEGLAFRQSIPSDLMALLNDWTLGFCPLNSIERSISDLIDARGPNGVERTAAVVTAEDAIAMLEPGDVLIDCHRQQVAASRSPRSRLGDVDAGANTLNDPARIRARRHVPVRPGVRLQRVLQVLQEHRERAVQVHSDGEPHALRRQRQPRDGHRQHQRRGVRGDAVPIRRRVASRATFPESPSRWTVSSTRSRRRRTARYSATSRSSGSPWISTGLATRPAGSGSRRAAPTTRSPARRCSSPAIRRSGLRTFSRFRLDSSARCTWRGSSRSVTYHSVTCSTATSCTSTSSGFASTCAAR